MGASMNENANECANEMPKVGRAYVRRALCAVCVGGALDLQLQWHSRQVLIADTICLAINCNIWNIHMDAY